MNAKIVQIVVEYSWLFVEIKVVKSETNQGHKFLKVILLKISNNGTVSS